MNLTEHFTMEEFTQSAMAQRYGIDNTPPFEIGRSLQYTAAGLERIRATIGLPIKVSSGYRCPELNRLVGGAIDSQHVKGEAVDWVCPAYGEPLKICQFLSDYMVMLGIDQMIQEGTWVHCSFTHAPRRQILTFKGGKYLQGLV